MHKLSTFSYADLSTRKNLSIDLIKTLEETGFFYLEGLPFSEETLDKLLHLSDQFFSLPLSQKQLISISNSKAYRGYSILGAEKTNKQTDWKESLDFALETPDSDKPLHGCNQWPKKPENFKKAFQAYYDEMVKIGRQLMRCISIGYGLSEQYFDSLFIGAPFCIMRILGYPASKKCQQGIGAHADYGCLNMLYQDQQGGLEILRADGVWQAVSPKPYSLLVNAGDMLSYWSGGRIRSLQHRVHYQGDKRRLSIPFFFEPGFDSLIKPFDDERKEAIHYGQHLLKAYERSFGV